MDNEIYRRPIHTEIEGEGTPYYELLQFLGGWFVDSDQGATAIVREYVRVHGKDAGSVVSQGRQYIVQMPSLREELQDLTHTAFDDERDAREWLEQVLDVMEDELFHLHPEH